MDVNSDLTRDDAMRLAWGLVIQNLRMRAYGPEMVSDNDVRTLATALRTPHDWGVLAACLVDISAQEWQELHEDDPVVAHREASGVALDMAASGGE